jgi:hypothetical protein
MKFMFYQFPSNTWHVSGLSCKDVPIFLEEFDEREFLFGIRTIPDMSDLRGITREQLDCLVQHVLWLDGQFGSLSL